MTRVRAELTEAAVAVLRHLVESDVRWHREPEIAEETGLGMRATLSALADLRRHELATEAGRRGVWSATGLGDYHLKVVDGLVDPEADLRALNAGTGFAFPGEASP